MQHHDDPKCDVCGKIEGVDSLMMLVLGGIDLDVHPSCYRRMTTMVTGLVNQVRWLYDLPPYSIKKIKGR